MARIAELTSPYAGALLTPRPGPGVCVDCFNLTRGYAHCYACTGVEHHLDAVVPISYSVAHERLHHALGAYKRATEIPARRFQRELAAILWQFLVTHEQCVARQAESTGFEFVTTVPSSDPARDEHHPLRHLVGELVAPTRGRFRRLLTATHDHRPGRTFDAHRYEPVRALDGQSVLLIDDTWTTGASAQSAAAALKRAGADTVAAVVIGRHVNRDWHENDARLSALARQFDWSACTVCAGSAGAGRGAEKGGTEIGRLLRGQAA